MLKKIIKTGEFKAWNFYKKSLIEKHNLTYLFWECTLRCNFFCQHCGSNACNKIFPGELKTEEIKKFFLQLAKDFDSQKIFISVTGGEPLMREDLFDVLKYIGDLGFRTSIVTNGYLIDKEVADKMKVAGVECVSISLDGLEETNDKIRGMKGAYKQALNALKLLSDENFLSALEVLTTVNTKNINELNDLYKILLGFKLQHWRLMEVSQIGRVKEDSDLLIDGQQLVRLLDFIKEKRKSFLKKKSTLNVLYGCTGFLGLEYEKEVRPNLFICRTGINVASILYNGDIFICPDVPRNKELIQGNIRKDNFKDIWENKFEFFRNKNNFKYSKCSNCEYWEECEGGGVHLWDFDKNEPKKCHLEMIR